MTGRAGVDEHAAEKVRAEDERVAKVRRVINTVPCEWTYRPVANVALDSLAAELVSLKDALGEAEQTIVTHQRWVSEVLDRVAERPAEEVDWVQEVYRPLRELPIPAAAAREVLGRQG